MRHVVLGVPLAAGAGFGLAGPSIARRLPPAQSTWLLSLGASVSALSVLAVMSLLGLTLVGQQPDIAREGHWSVTALRAHAPIDRDLGGLALGLMAAACLGGLSVALRRGLALRAAYRSCRELPPGTRELVVVPDPRAGAYAMPGRPGRIVVARSLLSGLSATERRVLLAHERAHLRRGHHWHLSAVALATGICPFLRPLRPAAAQAVERWADEEAAAVVGDRNATAAAIVRAALLLRGQVPAGGPRLAAAAHALPARVAALLDAPPRPRPALVAIAALMLLAGAVAAAVAASQIENLFELAMRAYQAAHGT